MVRLLAIWEKVGGLLWRPPKTEQLSQIEKTIY